MPSKGHVLVVDDETDTVSLIEMTLGLAGYQVSSVTHGDEALKKLSEDQFDVVLLDIMMPGISGFDVLTRLRGGPTPLPPVIILTARGRAEDRERGKSLGAYAYLTKPVTRGELLDVIQKAMGAAPASDAPA